MASKTLLLISPPVLYGTSWWANRIANKPHLASLTGHVRDLAESQTLELDFVAGEDLERLLQKVDAALTESVGLVGISCWTSLHYLGTLAVARRVRARAPHVPIVVGGHHPTGMPEDFTHATCDWVVRGDGEHPLRQLCSEWPKRPDAMGVLDGGVFDQTDPGHIDWEHYGRPGAKERVLWVGTSRGCAFQCQFCVEPSRGATYSRYSVDDALRIVEGLARTHGPRLIAFSDPLFGANRAWLDGFLDGLLARDLPLMFWAETRADLMTPALLERFKRCRFMLDFGLDTASEAMIVHMEKGANPEKYLEKSREIFEAASAIGLHHGIYLIFNHPGETPETARETQDFIDGLGARGGPLSGWLSAQTFFILPGTGSFRRMKHNAFSLGTQIHNPAWWRYPSDHYVLATDVLPSSAWTGREHELRDFMPWNQSVNQLWSSRYPEDVQRFRRAFYVG